MASNDNLQTVGFSSGLDACINVNPQNPVAISKGIMADAVEAIVGAAFVDGGLPAVRRVMRALDLVYAAPETNMVMSNFVPLNVYWTLRINLPVSMAPTLVIPERLVAT